MKRAGEELRQLLGRLCLAVPRGARKQHHEWLIGKRLIHTVARNFPQYLLERELLSDYTELQGIQALQSDLSELMLRESIL
jgi:hypothetical protein